MFNGRLNEKLTVDNVFALSDHLSIVYCQLSI